MSLHAGESSKRSLRLSFVTITPFVFCASCSMNLRGNAKSKTEDSANARLFWLISTELPRQKLRYLFAEVNQLPAVTVLGNLVMGFLALLR